MSMSEVDEAAKIISEAADPDANIIFGTTIDESMVDAIKITLVATGFDQTKQKLSQFVPEPLGGYGQKKEEPQQAQPVQQPEPQPTVAVNGTPRPVQPQEENNEDMWDIPAFLRNRN